MNPEMKSDAWRLLLEGIDVAERLAGEVVRHADTKNTGETRALMGTFWRLKHLVETLRDDTGG